MITRKIQGYLFAGFFVVASLSGSSLYSYEDVCEKRAFVEKSPIAPFALMTIPKAGSHLIIKALHFLTGGHAVWHTKFPSVFYIPPEKGFLYTHLCVSSQLEEDYNELPDLKKIVLVRDLRDVCVSIVSQIRKAPWPGLSGENRKRFLEMSFEEQLMFVINYDYDLREIASYAPNSLQVSIEKLASQAVRFSKDPSILLCRYENLVGPSGGGSLELQMQEVRAIADHIHLSISDEEIFEVASKLYGNTVNVFGKPGFKNFGSTFNQGQIGRWQSSFTEEHKIAFKEKLGWALIELGYEEDYNW